MPDRQPDQALAVPPWRASPCRALGRRAARPAVLAVVDLPVLRGAGVVARHRGRDPARLAQPGVSRGRARRARRGAGAVAPRARAERDDQERTRSSAPTRGRHQFRQRALDGDRRQRRAGARPSAARAGAARDSATRCAPCSRPTRPTAARSCRAQATIAGQGAARTRHFDVAVAVAARRQIVGFAGSAADVTERVISSRSCRRS